MIKHLNHNASSKEVLINIFASEAAELLEWLAQFGAEPSGGVTRLLYTEAWQQAQSALAKRMQSIGLFSYHDDAGNVFGRLQGTGKGVVVTGSHVDTVIHGGRFDGAYGIIAGIIAAAYLQEAFGAPQLSIDVVSFAEEEGSRFPLTFWGSGNVTGRYTTSAPPSIQDIEGISLEVAMHSAGFGKESPTAGNVNPVSDWSAFVELHIEQGSVLEREQQQIGIVQGIVGQRRYTFEVGGEANHAGTTPMSYRKDALCGASEMIVAIRDEAIAYGDPMVATVGRLQVHPGTVNVVAGSATFTLDVRHPEPEIIEAFCSGLQQKLQYIAERSGLTLNSSQWMDGAPSLMNGELTNLARGLCDSRGLHSKLMYSGAGHDAQLIAPICPTLMVFVPSRGGISHSPEEYTKPEDLAAGILVLVDLLYVLAYKGERL